MKILNKINQLKKEDISKTIDIREKEFESIGKDNNAIFLNSVFLF